MWTCRSARITPCFNSTTPLGPTSTQPGVSVDVAAGPDRQVDAQRNAVGEGQLDLGFRPRGAQHPHRGQHPPPRTDDHHRLLGGKKAVLVQVLWPRSACGRRRTAFPRPASVRWQCRAETLTTRFGLPGGPPTWASTISRTICSIRLPINRCERCSWLFSLWFYASGRRLGHQQVDARGGQLASATRR